MELTVLAFKTCLLHQINGTREKFAISSGAVGNRHDRNFRKNLLRKLVTVAFKDLQLV
ncbi:hypothetical protein D3C80_2123590 [compost metagenome]